MAGPTSRCRCGNMVCHYSNDLGFFRVISWAAHPGFKETLVAYVRPEAREEHVYFNQFEHNVVILLDGDCSGGLELKSELQAAGLEVVFGPSSLSPSTFPVIVVHADNCKDPAIKKRQLISQQTFPKAPVCIVTGFASSGSISEIWDGTFGDARDVIQAANLHFLSDLQT